MSQAEIDIAEELMPELDGIEVPNLDDYSPCPEAYLALERLYEYLSLYCEQKRKAMEWRTKGDIEVAQAYEAQMERTYKRLPAWARW